jgi:inosine-uridine nucleoside N-ribohydrolase
VPRKIIVDCDPGHADAIALLIAHGSPEIELLAITTVRGDTTLSDVSGNALAVAAARSSPSKASPTRRCATCARWPG